MYMKEMVLGEISPQNEKYPLYIFISKTTIYIYIKEMVLGGIFPKIPPLNEKIPNLNSKCTYSNPKEQSSQVS